MSRLLDSYRKAEQARARRMSDAEPAVDAVSSSGEGGRQQRRGKVVVTGTRNAPDSRPFENVVVLSGSASDTVVRAGNATSAVPGAYAGAVQADDPNRQMSGPGTAVTTQKMPKRRATLLAVLALLLAAAVAGGLWYAKQAGFGPLPDLDLPASRSDLSTVTEAPGSAAVVVNVATSEAGLIAEVPPLAGHASTAATGPADSATSETLPTEADEAPAVDDAEPGAVVVPEKDRPAMVAANPAVVIAGIGSAKPATSRRDPDQANRFGAPVAPLPASVGRGNPAALPGGGSTPGNSVPTANPTPVNGGTIPRNRASQLLPLASPGRSAPSLPDVSGNVGTMPYTGSNRAADLLPFSAPVASSGAPANVEPTAATGDRGNGSTSAQDLLPGISLPAADPDTTQSVPAGVAGDPSQSASGGPGTVSSAADLLPDIALPRGGSDSDAVVEASAEQAPSAAAAGGAGAQDLLSGDNLPATDGPVSGGDTAAPSAPVAATDQATSGDEPVAPASTPAVPPVTAAVAVQPAVTTTTPPGEAAPSTQALDPQAPSANTASPAAATQPAVEPGPVAQSVPAPQPTPAVEPAAGETPAANQASVEQATLSSGDTTTVVNEPPPVMPAAVAVVPATEPVNASQSPAPVVASTVTTPPATGPPQGSENTYSQPAADPAPVSGGSAPAQPAGPATTASEPTGSNEIVSEIIDPSTGTYPTYTGSWDDFAAAWVAAYPNTEPPPGLIPDSAAPAPLASTESRIAVHAGLDGVFVVPNAAAFLYAVSDAETKASSVLDGDRRLSSHIADSSAQATIERTELLVDGGPAETTQHITSIFLDHFTYAEALTDTPLGAWGKASSLVGFENVLAVPGMPGASLDLAWQIDRLAVRTEPTSALSVVHHLATVTQKPLDGNAAQELSTMVGFSILSQNGQQVITTYDLPGSTAIRDWLTGIIGDNPNSGISAGPVVEIPLTSQFIDPVYGLPVVNLGLEVSHAEYSIEAPVSAVTRVAEQAGSVGNDAAAHWDAATRSLTFDHIPINVLSNDAQRWVAGQYRHDPLAGGHLEIDPLVYAGALGEDRYFIGNEIRMVGPDGNVLFWAALPTLKFDDKLIAEQGFNLFAPLLNLDWQEGNGSTWLDRFSKRMGNYDLFIPELFIGLDIPDSLGDAWMETSFDTSVDALLSFASSEAAGNAQHKESEAAIIVPRIYVETSPAVDLEALAAQDSQRYDAYGQPIAGSGGATPAPAPVAPPPASAAQRALLVTSEAPGQAMTVQPDSTAQQDSTTQQDPTPADSVFSPGNSPGTAYLDGFTLSDVGNLLIEIRGSEAGIDFDLMVVNGIANLDFGNVFFAFIDGANYWPDAGDAFRFLIADHIQVSDDVNWYIGFFDDPNHGARNFPADIDQYQLLGNDLDWFGDGGMLDLTANAQSLTLLVLNQPARADTAATLNGPVMPIAQNELMPLSISASDPAFFYGMDLVHQPADPMVGLSSARERVAVAQVSEPASLFALLLGLWLLALVRRRMQWH
ncbi:MAG: PEP-CTERM sorting domain-containing protein [Gammaproteobacteria bacterium]|nr:PEP-CTERM sorting domain-containing protein [Gammaproteobacteria bacterium]